MVFLMVPFTMFTAIAQETEVESIDYTPFLLESINDKAVYNEETADLCYDLYMKSREYIDGNISSFTSVEYNGISYPVESVLYVPSSEYPTCDMLTCIVNLNVNGVNKHVVLVVFRGTDFHDAEEVLTDLACVTGQDGYHEGFEETAQRHYEKLLIDNVKYNLGNGEEISFAGYLEKMAASDSDYQMIVTGHSLGAAVAGVFTSKYLDNGNNITASNAVAYTFASPLTASYEQAAKEAGTVKNVFNIVNTDDIVTKIGANVFNGSRTGFDLEWKLGKYDTVAQNFKEVVKDTINIDIVKFIKPFKKLISDGLNNHHMGTAYLPTKNHINEHINEYTNTFVLYDNHDASTNTYQRIIFNNGDLFVKGSGKLDGNWTENTLLEWAKVSDKCTSLTFGPDCSITEIGDYAFAGMSQLNNELVLPESLEKIGNYAFFHCGFNGNLIIPLGMREVGISAFYGCSDLDSINAKEAANMTWGYGAFTNCVAKDQLILPIEDLGVDLKRDIFSTYYVEDNSGIYRLTVTDSASGNVVLPGDKVYYGRLLDEKIGQYPTFDFHYLLTEGNVDTEQSIESQSKPTIENVASIDEFGCITIDPSCEANKEFTVVVLYDSKGDPNYTIRESMYYTHFTVGAINNNFEGGLGTIERPYLIEKTSQLKNISNDLSAHYKLISDIDFNDEALSPFGTLSGSLDGNGYSISGFKIELGANAGLFTEIASDGLVKNLTIGEVDNSGYFGLISAGHHGGAELIAGGICAINYGEINNCTVSQMDIYASRKVDWKDTSQLHSITGGIAGRNYNIIKNCTVKNLYIYSYSDTPKDTKPAHCYSYAGGIVGINDGTVDSCSSLNNREIKSYSCSLDNNVWMTDWNEGEAQSYSGGLVSYNNKVVKDCYSYNNNITATAIGDGGEGSDCEMKGDYSAINNNTQSNCSDDNIDLTYNIIDINVSGRFGKTHYYIGDSLNLYGLIVRDDKGEILNGYTVEGFNNSKSGEQIITVTYTNGFGTFSDTLPVIVENIVPQAVVIQPKDPNYDIQKTLSIDDFTATAYYNNGTVEFIKSLSENSSNIVKFSAFSYTPEVIGDQVLQISYHYAYLTEEGKPAASQSMVAYSSVKVVCDCTSTTLENAVAPTVTEYGYTGDSVCTVCNAIFEEGKVIEMLECTNHTFSSWTNHSESQHTRFCECGKIEYADHSWDDGEETIPASHVGTGLMTYSCNDCEATRTEVIPMNDKHAFGAWTYYNELQHSRSCDCQEVEYADHVWVENITQVPTCMSKGTKLYTCKDCKVSRTETLPKNEDAHTFGDWTNYDTAKHVHSCECGEVEYAVHSWDGGKITIEPTFEENGERTYICTECQTTKTEVIPRKEAVAGDINGDGQVNENDVECLMKYLAGWKVDVIETVLDVNGDGKVNTKDTTRLMRYLNGWDVKLS